MPKKGTEIPDKFPNKILVAILIFKHAQTLKTTENERKVKQLLDNSKIFRAYQTHEKNFKDNDAQSLF